MALPCQVFGLGNKVMDVITAQSMFMFADARTGLPFRINSQVNRLIPEYTKMLRRQVDLEREEDKIKGSDHPSRKTEPGKRRGSMRGPRSKEQLRKEGLECRTGAVPEVAGPVAEVLLRPGRAKKRP